MLKIKDRIQYLSGLMGTENTEGDNLVRLTYQEFPVLIRLRNPPEPKYNQLCDKSPAF